MIIRILVVAFCTIVGLSSAPARAQEQSPPASRPPNIIHIVADDVGYDDLSCYGAEA